MLDMGRRLFLKAFVSIVRIERAEGQACPLFSWIPSWIWVAAEDDWKRKKPTATKMGMAGYSDEGH